MIDSRKGVTRQAPKQQDSYLNDAPAMPKPGNVPDSQKKAPKQPFTD